jgi:TIGR03009 family protein
MKLSALSAIVGLLVVVFGPSAVLAQQQPAPNPAAGAPFQLNVIEQGYLDQLLANWAVASNNIKTFRCEFERWDYNAVFGPGPNIPFSKDRGQISYSKPDKGSYQITEVNRWRPDPVPPGQQPPAQQNGKWVPDPNVVGEHWVCDGKSIHQFRHEQELHVVQPIPPQMQGQSIVDGPLPFLFGADAKKLKARYFLKVDEQSPEDAIFLRAYPRFQADKANYDWVRLSLDRKSLLPRAMELHLPDRSRHTYIFDLATVSVNGRFELIKGLFEAPRTPLGWKKVVENGVAQNQTEPPARH